MASAVEVGCWAHARRKLFKLKDADPRVAWPLKLIGMLYRIEGMATRDGLSPAQRRELRRYDLRPFRRYRQHGSTVMLRVVPSFFDQVFWPEFEAISAELTAFLADITDRVITEAIHGDQSDIEEVGELPHKK